MTTRYCLKTIKKLIFHTSKKLDWCKLDNILNQSLTLDTMLIPIHKCIKEKIGYLKNGAIKLVQ